MLVEVFLLGNLVKALGTIVLADVGHVESVKSFAFKRAQELSGGKGIINIGCGPHRTYQGQVIAEQPEVLTNLDIVPNGMPHFIQLNIEHDSLPFADKQFGCAFASHVFEHLDNWSFALEEACRVADHVVVVLPDPVYFSGWLSPSHRQHFSRAEMQEIASLYSNVEVYY